MEPRYRKKKHARKLPPWVGVLLTALAAGGLAFFFGGTQSYFVPSDSMVPTLVKGDEFRADTFLSPREGPKRGEIWVLRNPTPEDGNGPVLVKRVVGVPGDKLATGKGRLSRNGQPLDEPYLREKPRYTHPAVKLGDGEYWVLGDNRNASADSHTWGAVPSSLFIGRAFFRYWPLERMKWL